MTIQAFEIAKNWSEVDDFLFCLSEPNVQCAVRVIVVMGQWKHLLNDNVSIVASNSHSFPKGTGGYHTGFKLFLIWGFLSFAKKTLRSWEEVVGDWAKAAYFSSDDLEKENVSQLGSMSCALRQGT